MIRKRRISLLAPILAAILGAYAGFASPQCPTCTEGISSENAGEHSGTNKCFQSNCQMTQDGHTTASIQDCLREKCVACKGYPGATLTNCPAQSGACGSTYAVLCANLGGC